MLATSRLQVASERVSVRPAVRALNAQYPTATVRDLERWSLDPAWPVTDSAMIETLQVRPAGLEDKSVIIGLIEGAAAWLRTKNTDQWERPWPNLKARNKRVLDGLLAGHTWLVTTADGTAVATITCRRYGNKKLWPRKDRREPAVYVSRLVVARSHAGLGIGEALVAWAGIRAKELWHAEWVRIDVWTTNKALQEYYEKRGFVFCHELKFPEGTSYEKLYPSATLFQKPINGASNTPMVKLVEVSAHDASLLSSAVKVRPHLGAHSSTVSISGQKDATENNETHGPR